MNLYLTRANPDTAEAMAEWLRGHIGHVGVVIYFPDGDCLTTAKAFAKALGSHIADTRLPDSADELMRLAQQSTDVVIVTSGKRSAWATSTGAAVDFVPGSIAMVGDGILEWLVTPEIIMPDQEVVEAARSLIDSL